MWMPASLSVLCQESTSAKVYQDGMCVCECEEHASCIGCKNPQGENQQRMHWRCTWERAWIRENIATADHNLIYHFVWKVGSNLFFCWGGVIRGDISEWTGFTTHNSKTIVIRHLFDSPYLSKQKDKCLNTLSYQMQIVWLFFGNDVRACDFAFQQTLKTAHRWLQRGGKNVNSFDECGEEKLTVMGKSNHKLFFSLLLGDLANSETSVPAACAVHP